MDSSVVTNEGAFAARRIDLRRAAAGDQAGVGVAADDRDRANTLLERQHITLILQEDNALFGEPLGRLRAFLDIRNLLDDRMIEEAAGEDGA